LVYGLRRLPAVAFVGVPIRHLAWSEKNWPGDRTRPVDPPSGEGKELTMKWKTYALLLLALAAIPGLSGTALAGVEPSPFRVVITNRTDRLDVVSAYYNYSLCNLTLTLLVGTDPAALTKVTVPIAGTVAPGETLAVTVDPRPLLPVDAQIFSWSFSAGTEKMGVEPSPFRVFAFQTKLTTQPVGEDPPALASSYFTGEMPILGFAGTGVLLATVALVNDSLIYSSCPSVPNEGFEWKNHGHYVRCVAWKVEALLSTNRITPDEADAIVKAAAESEIGK
jgi:hypothetical protein